MEKMTFRQKFENFWYHNKFAVIVAGVFIVFLLVSLTQMIFKKSPDANLLYIGTASISFTSQDKLQESIATVMKEDYNEDGRRYVDYIELTVLDPEKAQDFENTSYTSHEIDSVATERFVAELIAGDSMIYLADEKYYKTALEQDVLMPLREIVGTLPEKAHDEYSVYLRDLDIFYLPGFNKLPGDTLLFVRYPVSLAESREHLEKREQCNLSVFRDMLDYVYPDKPEDTKKDAVKVSVEEFTSLYRDWCLKKGIDFTEDLTVTSLGEGEFFENTGATVYKCAKRTFICKDGALYSIGRSDGGVGVVDIALCDFDNNGVSDFIFTYNYNDTSYKNSASVFNTTTLREDFLGLENMSVDGTVLVLEKVSDGEFEIWQSIVPDGGITTPLYSGTGSVKIATILSKDSSIVKKTYK